ncbi:MAG: DNA-binding transcriptional regulator [Planctomycetes bacterium]|nr:DNA-binding transcriptional regulator [Planctomycetota bacterium]
MHRRPRVALLIETSTAYGRDLLRGISEYTRTHRPWSMYVQERGFEDPLPDWLARWAGDGVITRIKDQPLVRKLTELELPVVDVRIQEPDLGLPAVYCDQHAVGRLAAEHLLQRGFRHFAFCGSEDVNWSRDRYQGFREVIESAGFTCGHFKKGQDDAIGVGWEEEQKELAAWIQSLSKPCGLLASRDRRGLEILDACRRVNFAVPEEVAVVGVDNDELLCELADPPLSSVDQNVQRIGYEAAAMLERLMDGDVVERQPVWVQPLGIVARQSSDIVAIEDADVASACRFIREHACDGAGVEDVVKVTRLSRRALERRFRRWLGRSPKSELLRVQLDRVKQLLLETDYKLSKIAQIAGFQHVEYMSSLFKKKIGETPGQFRKHAHAARRPGAASPGGGFPSEAVGMAASSSDAPD